MKISLYKQSTAENRQPKTTEADTISLRRSITHLADENQAVIVSEDDTTLAAYATSNAVETIIVRAGWDAARLRDEQKKIIRQLIRGFASCLCYRLDADPKLVTMYSAMWIFRNDASYVYGSEILKPECQEPGNLTKHQDQYQLLTENIETWIYKRDAISTALITRLVRKLAMSSQPGYSAN